MVFTKNLRLVLGLAKGSILRLAKGRLKYLKVVLNMVARRRRELDLYLRRNFRRQRVFRDHVNPLEYLSDEQLLGKYRFSRGGIPFLTDLLSDSLSRATHHSNSIPVLLQVLSSLHFMACGSFQQVVADTGDISLSQASISGIGHSLYPSYLPAQRSFYQVPH